MGRGRVTAVMGLGVLVAASLTGSLLLVGQRHPGAQPARTVAGLTTATVTRGTLRQVQELTGDLGYGAPVAVTDRSTGILTWLPSIGRRVVRGEQLYRVDDQPVSVLYGDLPLYRTLTYTSPADQEAAARKANGGKPPKIPVDVVPPLTGHDVDLVATNLAALGYWAGPTVDAAYDAGLAAAVRTWQAALGRPSTGTLLPIDVVVTPGPVRVEQVTGAVGAAAAGEVLSWTGTRRVLTLRAAATTARALRPGDRVRVTLVDGTRLVTRIRTVGRSATTADGDATDGGGPPTVAVSVVPRRPHALDHATLGEVTATFATAVRRHVLSVPVSALLALAGGGYAVQAPDGSLLPVRIGMVAGDRVAVTGVPAGTRVVVV